MKKIVIILGIILTSGIAALALSSNNNNEIKTAEAKVDRNELANPKGHEFGNFKSDIANAD